MSQYIRLYQPGGYYFFTGLVTSPGDWEHSSFNYWVKKGIYEKDWGSAESIALVGMNEAE